MRYETVSLLQPILYVNLFTHKPYYWSSRKNGLYSNILISRSSSKVLQRMNLSFKYLLEGQHTKYEFFNTDMRVEHKYKLFLKYVSNQFPEQENKIFPTIFQKIPTYKRKESGEKKEQNKELPRRLKLLKVEPIRLVKNYNRKIQHFDKTFRFLASRALVLPEGMHRAQTSEIWQVLQMQLFELVLTYTSCNKK